MSMVLPDFHYITEKRIGSVSIKKEDILSLIRNLNPNKATGCDEISTFLGGWFSGLY